MEEPCRICPYGPESLDEHVQFPGRGNLHGFKLGQFPEARKVLHQGIEGRNHPFGGSAQFVNPVAPHVRRFGNHVIDAVFDGKNFHVLVIGPHIRSRNENILIPFEQPAEPLNDLFSLFFIHGTGTDNPGFTAPKGQIGGGIFQSHARARLWMISGVISGSIRVPPMEGDPMARLSTTR